MSDLSSIAQLASPTVRRLAVDSQIQQTRQLADPQTLAQREVPRLSIAELNDLDLDQVRERFVRSKADTRTPFVKFLDLVDLPRNSVANAIASFTAPELKQADARGAAGLARINFSDFLREMGVENRLVRGVVGFVGDLAVDPLTYLGGAGIGLQVAGKGGNVARIGLTGGRQLRRGIQATAKGGQAASPVVRELISSVASPRVLERGTQRFGTDRIRAALTNRLLGSPTTGQRLRDLALPSQAGDGLLSRSLEDVVARSSREAEQFQAAKRFVSEFGVGSNTRGIGPAGGTTVARIPFTDIGARVPAFTRTSQTQQGIAAIAGAGTVGASQAESIVRSALDAAGAAGELDPLRNASQAARSVQAARQIAQRIEKTERAIEVARDAGGIVDGRVAALTQMQGEFDDLVGSARQAAENSEIFINQFEVAQLAGADAATLSALGQRLRAQRELVLQLDLERNQEFRNLHNTIRRHLVDSRWGEVGDDILRLQDRLEAGEITQAEFLRGGEGFRGARDLLDEWDSAVSKTGESLVNMSELDAANALRMADAAQANFTSAFNLANAMEGSVAAFLKSEDRVLSEVARQQLGLGQGALGASLFVPMRVAAQGLMKNGDAQKDVIKMLDTLDAGKRRVFGQRGAEVSDLSGAMRFLNADGRDILREQIAAGWKRGVAQTLDEAGVSQQAYGRDATDLMQIMAHMRLHGQEISEGRRGIVYRFRAGTDDAIKTLAATDPYADEVMEAYTPMWRRFQEIRRDSFGGPEAYAQISGALDRQVESILETLAQAGQTGQAEGMLSFLLRGYVPKRLSSLADESVRAQRSLPGFSGRDGTASQAARAAFQKERSTDLYRFNVDDATAERFGIRPGEHEFMQFERLLLQMDPVQLDAVGEVLGPDRLQQIAEKRGVIQAFDELSADVAPEVKREVYGIPADIFRLNDEFQSGKFAAFADPSEIGPYLFDTDFPSVVADRLVEQIGLDSQRALRDTVLRMGLQTKVISQGISRSPTERLMFTNGMEGQVVSGPGQRQIVRIGEQRYRTLDPEIVGSNKMFAQGLGPRGSQIFLPEEAADAIEGAARVMSPDNANVVVRAADSFTNAWKTTTLLHPSWTMANIVGGIWQAGQNNLDNIRAIGQHGPKIIRAMMRRKDEAWMAENGIDLSGRGFVSYQNLVEDALRERVIGASRTSRIFVDAVRDGRYRPFPLNGGLPQYLQGLRGREDLMMSAEHYARAAGRDGVPNRMDWMRGARDIYVSERYLRRVAAPWYAANQSIEDSLRLATYVGGLERGLSPAQSGRMVREALFDYGDLTDIEARQFKRLFPFYTWMRRSGAYQLRQLMENPQVIALAPKLKENLEEALVGEAAMPDHLRPSWLREQVAVQIAAEPGREFGITTGTINPTETAAQLGSGAFGAAQMLTGQGDAEGVMDLAHYFGSSLAPWASIPIQVAAGREIFTDREIGPNDRRGDLSVSEFLLGQVRPFREFGVGSARQGPLQRAASEGPASLLGRATLGGRAQSFDPDRLSFGRLRELQDLETGIRRAINLYQREGRDSTQIRAELMQLYQVFIESGFEDEVPRWARDQLSELGSVVAQAG